VHGRSQRAEPLAAERLGLAGVLSMKPPSAAPRLPRVGLRWVAITLLLAIAGCQTLMQPEPLHASVVGIDSLPSAGLELRFAVRLRLQNPNDIGVNFDGVSFDLELDGERLASGVSDQKGTLPRHGETLLTLPVSVSTIAAVREALRLGDAPRRGGLPYVVTGNVTTGMFGSISFTKSGTLKLPP
jgi:LEA14-like dessication related protein